MQDFIAELSKFGYKTSQEIQNDGQIHRIFYEKEKKSSGRYCIKTLNDGFSVGWFLSDKDPFGVHTWYSKKVGGVKITSEQLKIARAELKEQRERQEIRTTIRHKRLADRLTKLYDLLPLAGVKHPYIAKKQAHLHGVKLRKKKNQLIIPLYQQDGLVYSFQKISVSGFKSYFRGGKIKDGFFILSENGDDFSNIVICEGFSTGSSLYQSLKIPVVLAFQANNLINVALSTSIKYPESNIIIAADNDKFLFANNKCPKGIEPKEIAGDDPRWKEWRDNGLLYNVGLDKATQAAAKIGGASVLYPEFDGGNKEKLTDWNDSYLTFGGEYVRNKFLDSVNSPESGGVDYDSLAPHDSCLQPTTSFTPILPFKILGYNEGKFYFLPRNSGQIFSSSVSSLAFFPNLFSLASCDYWQNKYNSGTDKISNAKIATFAADWLSSESFKVGVFTPDKVRGVGAWIEGSKPIIHCGDKLFLDDKFVDNYSHKGNFVYPIRNKEFPISNDCLSSKEAVKLRDICGKISWANKLSGDLLAGWITIAPLCGIFNWRPHIWVEGQSESGKSTVINKIVRPMLEGVSLRFDGGTTEAAIRQTLGCDALPVIYDEAEPENIKDRLIMDGLLLLARRASSGGSIAKGGAGGIAESFNMRSCFCFAGINPAIKQRADESRISRLVIKKAEFAGADLFYKDLKKQINETITKEFARGMIARSIKYLPVLLKNAEVFTDAAAEVLCSRRAADQMGVMLSGLYLLHSHKEITYEKAVEWIKSQDLSPFTAVDAQSDPERLITHISTSMARFNNTDIPIGELLERCHHPIKNSATGKEIQFLRLMGIWYKSDGIVIANRSQSLERVLKDTPWISWRRPLLDIAGSEETAPLRFGTGFQTRGVRVPLSAFGFEDSVGEEEIEF